MSLKACSDDFFFLLCVRLIWIPWRMRRAWRRRWSTLFSCRVFRVPVVLLLPFFCWIFRFFTLLVSSSSRFDFLAYRIVPMTNSFFSPYLPVSFFSRSSLRKHCDRAHTPLFSEHPPLTTKMKSLDSFLLAKVPYSIFPDERSRLST